QVHEAVPCYSECNQYSWVVEHWSPCRIHNELRPLRCGGGTQSRKIRCVNTASREGGAVNSSLCNQDEMPPETQPCSLLCPSECVMSEWGTWSKCPQCRSSAIHGFKEVDLYKPHVTGPGDGGRDSSLTSPGTAPGVGT
ncbi:Thrombospondin type-1 domain-containing protein 7B, partial [Myotis brandtii]